MVGDLARTARAYRSSSEPQASACASTPDAGLSRKLKPAARLRPPGALPEEVFLTTCTRCTSCQKACPYESIRRLGPEFGEAAGTPAIIPDESPCYLCEEMPCIAACEPMALRPLRRDAVAMGSAVVHHTACYPAQEQPCDDGVERCLLGANAMTFNQEGLPVVTPGGCADCGVCAYLCPAGAIRVEQRRGAAEWNRMISALTRKRHLALRGWTEGA
jgi:ferredoxin